MSNQMVIVAYNSNWADEMDVHGFQVMLEEDWESHLNICKQFFEVMNFNYHVGTNQEIEYDSFDQYVADFTVTKVSDEEAKTFKRLARAARIPEGKFADPLEYYGDDPADWNEDC